MSTILIIILLGLALVVTISVHVTIWNNNVGVSTLKHHHSSDTNNNNNVTTATKEEDDMVHLPSTAPQNNNYFPNVTSSILQDEDDIIHRLLSLPFISGHPNDLDFDYLIIQYHKTGHIVARQLTNMIKEDGSTEFNAVQHDPLPIRGHDPITKCPQVNLRLGLLNVQAAPDFFCDVNVLAEELLSSGKPKGGHEKRGIKIIHLIRNPFRLAVSNYKYHAQNPTPEGWVIGLDVCASTEDPRVNLDLVWSTLGPEGANVFEYGDFETILDYCHSLFRTRHGLETADYYDHLRTLDRMEGLVLATAHLMRGRLGDITRMANNIVKFQQLQQLEIQAKIAQHNLGAEKRIQVLTLAMDRFIQQPKETAKKFLDFILTDKSMTEVKERIAAQYENDYMSKVDKGDSNHIASKRNDSFMLEASLREHEFFGRILAKVERVVGDALAMNEL